jgi:hypothetical protein
MKTILTLIAMLPSVAMAQMTPDQIRQYQEVMGFVQPQQPAPVYGLPVQPVLPVPQDRGPWGTGYSIVTTTRPKQNIFNRDLTGEETVQRVVPNDALGQPMKGLDINSIMGW